VNHPKDQIKDAFSKHENIAISFSGAEDVIIIDMAFKLGVQPKVFSLDTGRLHPETYQFIERVRDHYGLEIELISPNGAALSKYVRENGLFDFYEQGHQSCCNVRKIQPLRHYLTNMDAWITGQRRDQSPTRSDLLKMENDTAFSGPNRTLTKYNPLAHWSSDLVWQYIRDHDVPYNTLHDKGYLSIGCEPCTRPIGPGEHERAGRWWWEEETKRECGLHYSNLKSHIIAKAS
jgi:phosphoadenosine phosphosulfate reductase